MKNLKPNKISKAQFEFYKQKHYELWDWLSRHPYGTKFQWFNSVYPAESKVKNDCFACEVAKIISGIDEGDSQSVCEYCPITDFEPCDLISWDCCGGLYSLYAGALRDEEKTKLLAEQIRDLPWNKNDILCYVED